MCVCLFCVCVCKSENRPNTPDKEERERGRGAITMTARTKSDKTFNSVCVCERECWLHFGSKFFIVRVCSVTSTCTDFNCFQTFESYFFVRLETSTASYLVASTNSLKAICYLSPPGCNRSLIKFQRILRIYRL